jgi:ParB/RepB/Spo0J family partition protein
MKTEKTTRSYIEVYIADIVSAVENLRDAVPRISNEGFGIFEGTDQQKDSLMSLALSQDSLQQKKYVKLIEEHEPEIEALADNMATMGLLEPICVRPAEDKGKFDLIFGCRRCLAWLYNHAKSAGKIPARITAEVVDADGKVSLLSSLSENMRVDPSPIDEAKSFKKLEKAFGMKASEIATATGKDPKVVRERLKLLKLPLDVQEKVHLGTLAQHKALALLEGKKGKATVPSPDPRRIPHIKAIEKLYHVPHDHLPPEYEPLITEEVRRLFAHWLKTTYKPQAEVQTPPASEEPIQSQPA